MSRIARKPTSSLKLYHHFALVTVAVSVVSAIVLGGAGLGGTGGADSAPPAAAAPTAKTAKAPEKKVGTLRDNRQNRPGSGFGSDGRFGSDNGSEASFVTITPGDALTAGLGGLQPPGAPQRRRPQAPTSEQLRKIDAMSRMRSGVGEE